MTAQEYVNGLFELAGHVGIITGASRGIGLGEAEALCNAGAEIYNFDLNDVREEDKKESFLVWNVFIRSYAVLQSMMNWKNGSGK